jgi:hypothetical protein
MEGNRILDGWSGRQKSDDCINSSLFLTRYLARVSCAARCNFFQLSKRMKKNDFSYDMESDGGKEKCLCFETKEIKGHNTLLELIEIDV